uniref:NADH dehydrogenase subunit 6 n=1 Tax=Amblyomma neumanni TaxID=251388 RepID=UPI002E761D0A|nr:NADH dehydrogenase subunit 6 [Amblyomma neumanni]WQF69054.1 NADH dehydrogenase subunit 6 [Amblyomma neumanni]
MKLILFFSILLISLMHPMMMLIAVILLTLFISITFYLNSCNSMFPLILILLILGGMLIIFMYMISLCPNKKMNYSLKFSILGLTLVVIYPFNLYLKILKQDLMKIYYFSFMNIMIMMMIYLLISLLVVMKNLNWISSPMKSN